MYRIFKSNIYIMPRTDDCRLPFRIYYNIILYINGIARYSATRTEVLKYGGEHDQQNVRERYDADIKVIF